MLTFTRVIILNALLASSILSQVTAASIPLAARNGIVHNPQDSPPSLYPPEHGILAAGVEAKKGKHLKIKKEPTKGHKCPSTKRYKETTYTSKQIKKAYLQAAKLANSGKQLGERKYPHNFGNGERIPFKCGSKIKEFPLVRNRPGHVYNGESVKDLPDRLVFEFRETKKEYQVGFCGVMRHGNGNDFVQCH